MARKPIQARFNIDAAAENAIRIIAAAQEAGARTLANAAAEAVKVVAATAAESAKNVEFRRTEDHDLLIRLEENMKGLKEDIKKLSDGSASQLADHESRLKKICEWRVGVDGKEGAAERILTLENSRLEIKTQVKTWLIIGGALIWILTYVVDKIVIPALK